MLVPMRLLSMLNYAVVVLVNYAQSGIGTLCLIMPEWDYANTMFIMLLPIYAQSRCFRLLCLWSEYMFLVSV